jgi:hypothetical protein
MKKISTAEAKQSKNFVDQKLTIGLDLGAAMALSARPSYRQSCAVASRAWPNSSLRPLQRIGKRSFVVVQVIGKDVREDEADRHDQSYR